MKQILLIFLGGGVGSVLRYGISRLLNSSTNAFPYGTLVANCLGSLLIGIFLGLALRPQYLSSNYIAFLVIGFCGGFTTFSTFTHENYLFLKSGDFFSFFIYTFISIGIGLLCVFFGYWMVKSF